jgi:hypothetical protein
MSIEAKQGYLSLTLELLLARKQPGYLDTQEDDYLDRLDLLWWAMTSAEMAEVEIESVSLYSAPAELGLVDVIVADGVMPRTNK